MVVGRDEIFVKQPTKIPHQKEGKHPICYNLMKSICLQQPGRYKLATHAKFVLLRGQIANFGYRIAP